MIDAPPDSKSEVENSLKENDLILKEIWLTHGHWDHMAGASDLNSEEIAVIGHRDDKIMFEQPSIMSGFAVPGLEMKPIEITRWVEHGEKLSFMGLEVEVRHCPGHCPGNVVFWFPSEKCCFVGDVIFGESVGRYDLPGGISINLKIPFNSKSILYHLIQNYSRGTDRKLWYLMKWKTTLSFDSKLKKTKLGYE